MPTPALPPEFRPRPSLPVLRTERLTLRAVTSADLDAVYGYLSREEVCRYLLHEPLSREETERKLVLAEKSTALRADGDTARLAVVHDDEVVGEVQLTLVSAATATVEIGWIFSPHVAGRGYATEAARVLLDHAFETLNAHRIIAHLHPDNTGSSRLCERLGMRHEALHRSDLWVKNGWEDTSIYAILRRDWAARR
ncbi:GNAT family N-acetyltransferase [Saccharomonospora piscinae]|uniref:GNAT family N-acetyltransferase n=1 Tax=Saccharomonospora piscinae TaxID=687388 RepID=A0A1V8ZYL7_SACPI|nr:GNAT family N-acetyltransferase [Saccharomonospora piscinae]OQO89843.1 GNAT family N-acetyltransferase [Saccharomonospora piscinae]